MAEVVLTVAGRPYRLACRDGEEAALAAAGRAVDARASALAGSLGAVGEARLLLMTALSFAGDPESAPSAAALPSPALADLANRLESLAEHLEQLTAAS